MSQTTLSQSLRSLSWVAALVMAQASSVSANDPQSNWMRFPGQNTGSAASPDYDRSFVKEWEANPPKGFPTLSTANIEPMKAAIKRYAEIAEKGGWQGGHSCLSARNGEGFIFAIQ